MLPCAHSSKQQFLKSHSCASYKCLLRTLPRADYLKRVGRFYEFDMSVGRTSSYVAPLCHIFRAAGSSRLARNQSLYNRRHPCLVNKGCCGSFVQSSDPVVVVCLFWAPWFPLESPCVESRRIRMAQTPEVGGNRRRASVRSCNVVPPASSQSPPPGPPPFGHESRVQMG
ncbi:unnamed protein product [Ixodes pacificus]